MKTLRPGSGKVTRVQTRMFTTQKTLSFGWSVDLRGGFKLDEHAGKLVTPKNALSAVSCISFNKIGLIHFSLHFRYTGDKSLIVRGVSAVPEYQTFSRAQPISTSLCKEEPEDRFQSPTKWPSVGHWCLWPNNQKRTSFAMEHATGVLCIPEMRSGSPSHIHCMCLGFLYISCHHCDIGITFKGRTRAHVREILSNSSFSLLRSPWVQVQT